MTDEGTPREDAQDRGHLRIMKLLPHRYPFLLIDRMIDIDGEESGTGVKNVTINEPFFQGHFPGRPVMPGVLLVEAMAQTAGALVLDHLGDEHAGKLVFFMSIDKCPLPQAGRTRRHRCTSR